MDSLSQLYVLHENVFEGEPMDPVADREVEAQFYKGAPARWRNFFLAEQPGSDGEATPWIKRDGYRELKKKILEQRGGSMTSVVKLLHQPGSGGTTLAMQVLWDLRKTLRCAVLSSSTLDVKTIARQVIHLFTGGERGQQKTVLLLLNDEKIQEDLPHAIKTEIKKRKISVDKPVVIVLNCVRETYIEGQRGHVVLRTKLSPSEVSQFKKKQAEINQRYREEHPLFHGFNIMRSNFSKDYVQDTCANITLRPNRRSRKSQLLAFVAQVNAYVPGSFLLQSQCLTFLGPPDPIHGGPPFEQRMEPFTHLIVTSSSHPGQDKQVCMAHPMIAQHCVELLAEAGVTKSDTARNFLSCFCRKWAPPSLMSFIKDMLTKRELQNNGKNQAQFSRLILDINTEENFGCARSVLELASDTFTQNPFFPQALARLLYIIKADFQKAAKWASKAIQRDSNNSFIADTLGQIRKNLLRNAETQREMLKTAKDAIDAFKDEEEAAERENELDMRGEGMIQVSRIFNNRGIFGYLQVANILFDLLVDKNLEWGRVLTRESPAEPLLASLEGKPLFRYSSFVKRLREEVEKKCEFFFGYLTYSNKKDEPYYVLQDVHACYNKYIGKCKPRHFKQYLAVPLQKLKEEKSQTFPGLISSIEWETDLRKIVPLWMEILRKDPGVNNIQNFILANIMLSNVEALSPLLTPLPTLKEELREYMKDVNGKQTPEFWMLALLLFWFAGEKNELGFDVIEYIKRMRRSYGNTYQPYLRSRYLRPLFFLGNGKGFSRLVHSTGIGANVGTQDWSSEEVWKDPGVQARLLRLDGEMRNYRVTTEFGGHTVQLFAHPPANVGKEGRVSFYLGFNIRGPVAFNIHHQES